MIEGMYSMEEESAAVSQVEEGNLQKLQVTIMDWIKEHPNNASLVIRTWLLKEDYTDRQKAAIFLIAIGSDLAVKIYKCLREDEIETLTFEIARLGIIETDRKSSILKDFNELMTGYQFASVGGIEFARELLEKSLGSQKAIDIINRFTMSLQVRPFDFIRRTDPAHLLNFIRAEHPQTIALVLAYLEPHKASVILDSLPGDIQGEVARRIAIMDSTSPEVLRELERVLEKKLSTLSDEECHAGGIESIVEILNMVCRDSEKKIIKALEDEDPELAYEIKNKMFIFEDIVMLDDRSIQKILREVDSSELAKALKGVDVEVQDKIFRNMSRRAAIMLKEDMEYMDPIRLKDVEDSQQKIIAIIKNLEDSGEIDTKNSSIVIEGVHSKRCITFNDIISKMDIAAILEKIDYPVLVMALKLSPSWIIKKMSKSMLFFKRFKFRWDIRLRSVLFEDVEDARYLITSVLSSSLNDVEIAREDTNFILVNSSEKDVLKA
jgi:flagellar motor switch protein FliG